MKNLVFRFAAVLFGVLVFLTAAEIFMRVNPGLGYNRSRYQVSADRSPMLRTMNNQARGIYRPSDLLGYEHVPGDGNINSRGMVGKDYGLGKDDRTFRILLLGDSIAEQDYSRQELERLLNDDSSLNGKYRFEIWNAGVGGYDVHHYAVYLQQRGLAYSPDMVMVFLFVNDFTTSTSIYYKNGESMAEYSFPMLEITKRIAVSPFWMKHSYLYRWIILSSDRYFSGKKTPSGFTAEEESGIFYLRQLKEACGRNHLPLFCVVFPYLKPWEDYNVTQKQEYLRTVKIVKMMKVNYLDLFGLYLKLLKGGGDLWNVPEDFIHPSQAVHTAIAGEIFSYLKQNALCSGRMAAK